MALICSNVVGGGVFGRSLAAPALLPRPRYVHNNHTTTRYGIYIYYVYMYSYGYYILSYVSGGHLYQSPLLLSLHFIP